MVPWEAAPVAVVAVPVLRGLAVVSQAPRVEAPVAQASLDDPDRGDRSRNASGSLASNIGRRSQQNLSGRFPVL
jgi:hypothetical protein